MTMDSLHGPDPALPIDALLAELDHSSDKQSVRYFIKKAVGERQNQVDADNLNAGMQIDYAMHNPSAATTDNQVPADNTSSTLITFSQSSATAIASTKHPRDAQPLKMVETETYAEANFIFLSTPVRLIHIGSGNSIGGTASASGASASSDPNSAFR